VTARFEFDDDHFHDHCGVFGVFGNPEAAKLAYLGLYALQHRGQESAGICASDGTDLRVVKGMGLVQDIFDPKRLAKIPGDAALGHTRYSTAGDTTLNNAQPIVIDCNKGKLALGHNGNLINAAEWRRKLEHRGSIFQTTSDTEVIVHLIARSSGRNLSSAIAEALNQVEGAYSLLLLTRDELYAIRDPRGFRPLCLGRLGDTYLVASETCAFDLIDATYIREIEPGEMLRISRSGLESIRFAPPKQHQYCIFEHVYFARPDSLIFGRSVHNSREMLGRLLAREHPVDADVVVPVPDSGVPAAIGYALESGIPFRMGLIRNHYIGRTFIQPAQAIRDFGVKLKLNPVRGLLEGKKVVLVDDSIVRGTTSRKIVRLVREAGAAEVHVRISSPPTISPCYYGIDTPTYTELIASSQSTLRPRGAGVPEVTGSVATASPITTTGSAPTAQTIEEICRFLEADSLGYLSLENLRAAVSDTDGRVCSSCFTGSSPTAPVQLEVKHKSQQEEESGGQEQTPQVTVTRDN
jgi:amidophosphoribosyltransferase